MDAFIKDVQMFFANQMEAHGFGRKTFSFETDAHGKAVVNRVVGQFPNEHYDNLAQAWTDVWKKIDEQFDTSKDIYLTAIDIDRARGPCGIGSIGKAIIPASGDCFQWRIAAHELAHAFGLHHGGYLTDAKPDQSYTDDPMLNAFCTAEWLDVHSAFNPNQPPINNAPTTIEMLPPSLAAPPNSIRLRFEVTDPDGIQQVQLFTEGDQVGTPLKWVACKSLNRTPSSTVEVVTSYLTPKSGVVYLQVLDTHGNSTGMRHFPIDITPLLPDNIVSIPDPGLAAAVQDNIGNSITTRTMLNLTRLEAHNRQVTDLTGLEHAHNLEFLKLGDAHTTAPNRNTISDFSPIAGLTALHTLMLNNAISDISNISVLAALPQLTWLELTQNNITDISPLADFTQVVFLWLQDNAISDVSALSSLTQLEDLHLSNNAVSDISVLTGLKHMRVLSLYNNPIANITPLTGLTQLIILNLSKTTISDVTPLAGLTQLRNLHLSDNQITDITPLTELNQLTTLDLPRNQIEDITSLTALTQMEYLSLHGNQISNVRPLEGLINLQQLWLQDNPINDREPLLALLRKNPEVKIYLKHSGEPLPVTLSHFRAELTNTGVVLKWITQSEVDNAGFYISRSETKNGEFKVVNPTMIQGAGTSSERNEYIWTDTTAKPNVAYYYRIEDISHAGVRKQLTTVRMRGLISASGNFTTMWAGLKAQE